MAIYTKQETAQLLRVAPITIDRLRKCGRITYHKVGRRVVFTQEDIDRFLEFSSSLSLREQQEAAGEARRRLRRLAIAGAGNE